MATRGTPDRYVNRDNGIGGIGVATHVVVDDLLHDSTKPSVLVGSNEGALNGATPVTVVDAPAAATQRIVDNIGISNKDTAAVTVTLSKNKGGTLHELYQVTLASGSMLEFDRRLVLDETDESIEVVMSGAPATINPDYDCTFADYS